MGIGWYRVFLGKLVLLLIISSFSYICNFSLTTSLFHLEYEYTKVSTLKKKAKTGLLCPSLLL